MEYTKIAIIGGGVAGLTTAIAMQKLGIQANVYEQAARLTGIGAGFGLAANAMHALNILGLREGVEKIGHFLPSYNIVNEKGRILIAPKTEKIGVFYQQKNFALHRGELHSYLLSQLKVGQVKLAKRAIRIAQNTDGVCVFFSDGTSIQTEALIVADGVRSQIRQFLLPNARARYAGYTCWRAVIDKGNIELASSMETWGSKGRFGMTPLVGDKIYWYACINGKENDPVLSKYTIEDLQEHFKGYHPPIQNILKNTANEQLIRGDIMDIKPLTSFAFNKILLIGDAAHATTPNMGQGACQAIEDVAILYEEIQRSRDFNQVFQNVSNRRLGRTRYITETSRRIGWIAQWENKPLVAVRNFLLQCMPEQLQQLQLKRLLNEDFTSINP